MEFLLAILIILSLCYLLYSWSKGGGEEDPETETEYRPLTFEVEQLLQEEEQQALEDSDKVEEEEQPMAKKSTRVTYHVVPKESGGWQLKKEGAKRAVQSFDRKAEAVAFGKDKAKSHALGQLIVHKKDGTIQTEYTYGADPRKTKG